MGMIITEITPQKKNTGRYNIFIDNAYAFALPLDDIAYFKLKEGFEVGEETVEFIHKNLIYIKAQDTALHFIGYKMRTEKEVAQKLREKEYTESVILQVLIFLNKYGYVNDRVYAVKYIRERRRLNPRGNFLLKMELLQKGVTEEISDEVLAEEPSSEVEEALFWLRKKSRGLWPLEEKKKKQLYGFLLRKGYSYDVIKDAFQNMDKEEGE